ncbi:UDP-N-acetylglucosamine 2-epimerase [Magnetovibrio sp.]|uniref:UDP-N-acetylglucosamine 2-epimerase n=1 Tax=Magnetovibrio sp. TaxID=2024836 RepID=UPI002F9599A6
MTKRHIAVLTGKRGGYGAMKPLLYALDQSPDTRLSLIVTDQHVNPKFGSTISEVEQDFTVAAAVDMEQKDGSAVSRSRALGVCLTRMGDVLHDLKPDILVLYGDRGEVLSTAVSAIHLGIPIAHLQGGDITGNVDELIRHALTKLSHLHFPSNEQSGERIRRMGEEVWRVHVVGDNHVDPIVAKNFADEATIRQTFGLDAETAPIVILQHPETVRDRDHFADMKATLDAALEQQRPTIIVYPCSDHGYEEVIQAIETVRNHPLVSVHKNIDAPFFWGLLNIAGVMLGNSSAGLIETPYFRIPAINLGDRQTGRLHAQNVIHAPFDKDAIATALHKALKDPAFRNTVASCDQPFGDGQAWKRTFDVLRTIELGHSLFNKRMTY